MKSLTILLMKIMLKRLYRKRQKECNFTVKSRYDMRIDNYQDIITYLKAQK